MACSHAANRIPGTRPCNVERIALHRARVAEKQTLFFCAGVVRTANVTPVHPKLATPSLPAPEKQRFRRTMARFPLPLLSPACARECECRRHLGGSRHLSLAGSSVFSTTAGQLASPTCFLCHRWRGVLSMVAFPAMCNWERLSAGG